MNANYKLLINFKKNKTAINLLDFIPTIQAHGCSSNQLLQ